MKKRNGFSLIELLVVITIIGILSAIGLTSYRSANAKARDSRRLADVQAIQSALEVYRSESATDMYPTGLDVAGFSGLFTDNKVPTPPSGDSYTYACGPTCATYTLTYNLETDDLAADITVHNP